MGRPSKEKSSAELPTINKTDTRKELAKLAGVGERTYGKAVIESNKTRNSSYPPNLGDMKKERNRDNETERQLAKLANDEGL